MIALYVIGHAYVAAVIITAGQVWIVGAAHGLKAAIHAAATNPSKPTPTPSPRPPEPRKWSTDNTGEPVLLWPHGN